MKKDHNIGLQEIVGELFGVKQVSLEFRCIRTILELNSFVLGELLEKILSIILIIWMKLFKKQNDMI